MAYCACAVFAAPADRPAPPQAEDYNTELNDMVAASTPPADLSVSPIAMTAAGEDWGLSPRGPCRDALRSSQSRMEA